MKSSAISRYIDHHADGLGPETRQLLARLPDNAVELAHAALFGDAGVSEPPDNDQVRRNVPALNSLSDDELDLALAVASQWFVDAMAAEEHIAETGEYMTEEEYERMSDIARGAA
jgi:hypothetical protein